MHKSYSLYMLREKSSVKKLRPLMCQNRIYYADKAVQLKMVAGLKTEGKGTLQMPGRNMMGQNRIYRKSMIK